MLNKLLKTFLLNGLDGLVAIESRVQSCANVKIEESDVAAIVCKRSFGSFERA